MAARNPRERLLARGATQAEICMRHCAARCCRYITVGIPTPAAESDWDEMRWWLAHEGVLVSKDEDGWLVSVALPCRHLRRDGGCGVYGERMDVCEKHAVEDCEFALPLESDVELRSEADLASYLERRRLKRGRRVARSIRRAEALRAAPRPPPLLQVLRLGEAR